MMTCAFLPNGGMTTEPGPDEVAIGVAGAVDAGPPGLNAGGAGELHAARPEQTRTVQTKAARGAVAAGARTARVVADARAARVVAAARRGWRFMRLMSARMGGARR